MQNSGLEKIRNLGLAMFEYDFSLHGGAVGAITVENDSIPNDAVIMGGFVEVKTAILSDGAGTVSLGINSATDILGVTAKGSLTAAALLDSVPDWTAANMIKTADDKNLTFTVGTAALTAGKLWVVLFYVVTD